MGGLLCWCFFCVLAFCGGLGNSCDMSRKDPRRRMMVPMSAQERVALRALARRGLGDALRRVVVQELVLGLAPQQLTTAQTALPLQLPRKTQQQLADLADLHGVSTAEIARQALAQHLRRQQGF